MKSKRFLVSLKVNNKWAPQTLVDASARKIVTQKFLPERKNGEVKIREISQEKWMTLQKDPKIEIVSL